MAEIIVTGGAGFIGSHLTDKLIADGHNVLVIDNFITGKLDNLNPKAKVWHNNAELLRKGYTGDICGLESFFRFGGEMPKKVDIVYHLAALARIQPSFNSPWGTYEANSTGTIIALEIAKHYKAKLVYAGSSSVYHDPHANPYSYTKWLGEEHCKLYTQLCDVPCAIARFFNVYGPRHIEVGPFATVIGIFEKQWREGRPLTITGTGEQRRDFTHVADIVNGLVAMSVDEWHGEVFNLGTGCNYSINEVADMFGGEKQYIPKRPGEAQDTLADISFSKRMLNWEPRFCLKNYIEEFKRGREVH